MNRDDLLATLRPLALQGFFLAAFVACRGILDGSRRMPTWLAVACLAALVTETLAVLVKLRAVRHRVGDGSLSPLPGPWVLRIAFAGLRVAVLSTVALEAIAGLVGHPPSTFAANGLITLVAAKEILVLALLAWPRPEASVPARPAAGLEPAADLNLVFVSVFPALLLADLFSVPLLDTSWNPIFLAAMVLVCLLLFFLMVTPFRMFAAFRAASSADERTVGGVAGWISSAVVWILLVAPLFYDSDAETERLTRALAARPDASEFVYDRTCRLKASALEHLCELPSLHRLALHTRHTGYLPPCVCRIPGLTELDIRGNRFETLEVGEAPGLVRLVASHNRIAHVRDLNPGDASRLQVLDLGHNVIRELDAAIARFPELVELDLSHNPLQTLPPEIVALRHLQVVRLEGTDVSPDVLHALQPSMPGTRFER